MERFRDFANGSAPATTFAVAVTAALGGISKPAAAAGMATTGSTVAGGVIGKLVFGTAGAVASGSAGADAAHPASSTPTRAAAARAKDERERRDTRTSGSDGRRTTAPLHPGGGV